MLDCISRIRFPGGCQPGVATTTVLRARVATCRALPGEWVKREHDLPGVRLREPGSTPGSAARAGPRFRARPRPRPRRARPSRSCSPTSSDRPLLGHGLDPESLLQVMARYFEAMRAAIERHGGTRREVHRRRGDGGVRRPAGPRGRRAARGARRRRDARRPRGAQRGARARPGGSRSRSGPASTPARSSSATATRGQARSSATPSTSPPAWSSPPCPGEILLGETTYHLVRDAVSATPVGPLAAEGQARAASPPGSCIEVVARRERLGAQPRAGSSAASASSAGSRTPSRAWRRGVVRARHRVRPGRGRASRASATSSRPRLGARRRVVEGRCLPYGEGITFWPIARRSWTPPGSASATGPSGRGARSPSCWAPTSDAALVAERLVPLLGARPRAGRDPGDLLGGPQAARAPRRAAPARGRVRRHPLGRADVPRPARVPRRLAPRRARCSCSASRAPSCSTSGRTGRRRRRTRSSSR